MCAAHGQIVGYPDATLVSVLLAPWFDASIIHEFRRSDFTPVPSVDVVMLRLRKRGPSIHTLLAGRHRQRPEFVAHHF